VVINPQSSQLWLHWQWSLIHSLANCGCIGSGH